MSIPATAIDLSSADITQLDADWLVLAAWADAPPSGPLAPLVAELRKSGDVTSAVGEVVPLLQPRGVKARRVLLLGLGDRDEATRQTLHDAAATALRTITSKKVGTVALALPQLPAGGLLGVGVGAAQGVYGVGVRKSAPTRFAPDRLLLVSDAAQELPRIRAESAAMWLARDLVNAPPNDLFPETFAAVAETTARDTGMEFECWDETRLEEERMGALLGVARGSARPPRLVILRYSGNPGGPLLALVGKGVTFDSGGLSLKTNENMLDMKCDMAGAAAVLGGMKAAAELKLPVNLLGVLALVENMPGGRALKLGDVLTARNGKTIEVLNTDAEGRLILADTLAYAAEQKPVHVLDFATLTGACLVALGTHTAGLMTNSDAWGDRVLGAVNRAGERAWKLPMDAHYDDLIRSKVADMRNTGGGRWAGAIAGAKFLEQFVGGVPWVHLDIAGPAWAECESPAQDAGGTGCMVRAIVELASGVGT